MDKYQKKILEDIGITLLSKKGDGKINITDKTLTLIQNENYNIFNYVLQLHTNAIETIKTDKKSYQVKKDTFEIDIDFNEQISFMELYSKNNIVEPIKLKVKYKNADKETYDEKITQDKRNELLKKLGLLITKGNNLINIYWNLISEKVSKTKVILYLNYNNEKRYMSEKYFENDTCYHSINNLAYGSYSIKVIQYAETKELLETDYIDFSVEEKTIKIKSEQPLSVNCNGGRHTVVI